MKRIQAIILKIMQLEADKNGGHDEEIRKLCTNTLDMINNEKFDIHEDLYRYLEDFDIRQKDTGYKKYQTLKIKDKLIQAI